TPRGMPRCAPSWNPRAGEQPPDAGCVSARTLGRRGADRSLSSVSAVVGLRSVVEPELGLADDVVVRVSDVEVTGAVDRHAEKNSGRWWNPRPGGASPWKKPQQPVGCKVRRESGTRVGSDPNLWSGARVGE